MEFVAFPQRNDALISLNKNNVNVEASGSLGLYYDGKCHETFPNETMQVNEKLDWCSNIAPDKNTKPWISYNIKAKAMRLKGFSIRNGCCWYDCCCTTSGETYDYLCCCRLYSFSLLGSNDNKTWKVIHKVEKEKEFYECVFKTYDFPMTESFTFVRIVQDEPRPGCPLCMQLNQVELYGETVDSKFADQSFDGDDNDESVSIIGKIRSSNE